MVVCARKVNFIALRVTQASTVRTAIMGRGIWPKNLGNLATTFAAKKARLVMGKNSKRSTQRKSLKRWS